MIFNVTATNDKGITGSYPAGMRSVREESARRWLVAHYLQFGFRCLKIERVYRAYDVPDKFPIVTMYREPKYDVATTEDADT